MQVVEISYSVKAHEAIQNVCAKVGIDLVSGRIRYPVANRFLCEIKLG